MGPPGDFFFICGAPCWPANAGANQKRRPTPASANAANVLSSDRCGRDRPCGQIGERGGVERRSLESGAQVLGRRLMERCGLCMRGCGIFFGFLVFVHVYHLFSCRAMRGCGIFFDFLVFVHVYHLFSCRPCSSLSCAFLLSLPIFCARRVRRVAMDDAMCALPVLEDLSGVVVKRHAPPLPPLVDMTEDTSSSSDDSSSTDDDDECVMMQTLPCQDTQRRRHPRPVHPGPYTEEMMAAQNDSLPADVEDPQVRAATSIANIIAADLSGK